MTIRYLIAYILLLGPAFSQSAVFESKRAPADVRLTADPQTSFWRDVKGLAITTDSTGNAVPDHRTEVRSRWTAGNLYLLYICQYDELNLKSNPSTTEETNQLWNWDVAEAFLGSDFKDIARYKEFEVSPQGEWVDLDIDRSPQKRGGGIAWNSGFESKARVDQSKKVWYAEMKIPFRTIGVDAPAAGTQLRTGLYRIGGRGPERKLLSWQVTGARSFHVPERFGILRLSE